MRARAASALLLAALAACGVGTYRSGRVSAALELRLVAPEGQPGERVRRWFRHGALTLEAEPFVQTEHVREVQLESLPDERRQLVLYLDEVGAQRLAEVTQAHPGRRLAVVVDGRVLAAPVIRGPITEGAAVLAVPDDQLEPVFSALTR